MRELTIVVTTTNRIPHNFFIDTKRYVHKRRTALIQEHQC
ncbi:MAG: hypothetical protein ACI90V_004900 [Bacillariaceae sp.]|jgi:hypothetical protein